MHRYAFLKQSTLIGCSKCSDFFLTNQGTLFQYRLAALLLNLFITSALGDALCKQTLLYTYLHNNHTNVTNVSLRPFVLLPAQFCVLIVLLTLVSLFFINLFFFKINYSVLFMFHILHKALRSTNF